MCAASSLGPGDLHRPCDPAAIPFATTAEAAATDDVIGQDRAVAALRFGIGIRQHGYNLFAIGPAGVGKHTLIERYLGQQAAREPVPSDWCYVHDFAEPEKPRLIELPPGRGSRLVHDMARAVAELRVALRAAFDSEEHRTRKHQLIAKFKARQERALGEVQAAAARRDVAVVQSETGIVLAPIVDGGPIDADKFQELPAEQRERLGAALEQTGDELQRLLRTFHDWLHEHRAELDALDREIAAAVARRVLDGVRAAYAELPAVVAHLTQIELDVVEHADEFLEGPPEGFEAALRHALRHDDGDGPSFRRYRVNLLCDRGAQRGAPIVHEDNPTHDNLVGRIEHETQFGALITNFNLIKPGALHRAEGGYLILDARQLLTSPYAWDALKRALRRREIRIESLGQMLGLVSTVSLEPAAVPLGRTKVILTGERILYYLLAELDPDFLELFKVVVDFEDRMARGPDDQALYANLLATLVKKHGLRPFDRGAIARVIEHATRLAGDVDTLSMHMRGVTDLLREADFWAGDGGRATVSSSDVQAAIDAQLGRSGRVRDRLREALRKQDLLIATADAVVGQVNGLSVFQLGEQMFGQPTRITARVRLGKGEVVDIEREVELGGPIHSKGVLILTGFLGARYATSVPLSLAASLVFEQSYGGVEGDSASLAELCALLSALAELPIRQSVAVTGSVNQHGQVQSIGGVNEKIEAFFDLCQERGLAGDQGVIVPRSNVKNLMLRRDVVAAVETGRFQVHAVDTVDDALGLLTGRPAGARDAAGHFPGGSVNALVETRLVALAERARSFAARAPL